MDYFVLLGQERLPWLDPDALKARFLALSAEAHPDRAPTDNAADKEAANQRFAQINAAYTCLREPKDRLACLIELDTGRRPEESQEYPTGLVDLFFDIAPVFQGVDKFLKERSRVTSPLAKVQLFTEGMDWVEKLTQLQGQLNARRQKAEEESQALNAVWAAERPIAKATALYREFSFLKRWTEQTQERISRLATD
jgi:hypothetical protein